MTHHSLGAPSLKVPERMKVLSIGASPSMLHFNIRYTLGVIPDRLAKSRAESCWTILFPYVAEICPCRDLFRDLNVR